MNYQFLGEHASLAAHFDLFALQCLSTVSAQYVPWNNAALRPSAVRLLLNDIMINRRRRVVEFGTGISTLYLAAALAECGGSLLSFDHDGGWQERVSDWMAPASRAAATLVTAPLRAAEGNEAPPWYEEEVVKRALEKFAPVDLVIVDGPPAFDEARAMARRPALYAIQSYLGTSACVVLDDFNRGGEQAIAREWSVALRQPFVDLKVRAGVALWMIGDSYNIV